MAGGKGTRIASITNDEIPKPMLEIGKKPIIEHQISCLKENGINEFIVVVGHLGDVIKSYFKNGEQLGVRIDYLEESENKPLGTAGSLYYLKETLLEDFVLVFGDVFFDVDFRKMVKFHKKHKAVATLLTHPNSHPFDSDLIVADHNDMVMTIERVEFLDVIQFFIKIRTPV